MQGSSSSQHGSSTSGRHNSLGLLANSQVTRGEGDSEEDWVSLINPHISQEERDELLSDDSQSEVDEEDRYQGEVSDEAQSFLDLAFKKAASNNQRKKWLENFPRPTSLSANPPTIDKPMYSLIQSSPGPTKKKILSHDRFLVKLQRYASDAAGPLTFLLSELQAGRPVPANKSLHAIQTALCCVGNAFAHLSVERRKCILQHLKNSLFQCLRRSARSMEPCLDPTSERRLRIGSMPLRAWQALLLCFFDSATPRERDTRRGRGVAEKAPSSTTLTSGREEPSGASLVNSPGRLPRNNKPTSETTTTGIQSAKGSPPPLIFINYPSSGSDDDESAQSASTWDYPSGSIFHANHCPIDSRKVLHSQLAQDFRERLDTENSRRVRNSTYVPTTSVPQATKELVIDTISTSQRGVDQASEQGRPGFSRSVHSGFLFSHIYDSEEERRAMTDNQFEKSESVHTSRTLQNGGTRTATGYAPSARLDDEGGSKRSLLLCTNPPQLSRSSEDMVEQQALQVRLPFGLSSAPRTFTKLLTSHISQWETNKESSTRPDPVYRCLPPRVGSNLSRSPDRRCLVHGGTQPTLSIV